MDEIRNLIDKLNYYTKLYDAGTPAITDYQWDSLYFMLVQLENEYKIYYPDSPTQNINYQIVNNLKKVEHNHKMLSLAKTKSIDDVTSFLGNNDFVAMAKMDGLTCSLLYEDGKLISAETRGNGIIGEDVTHNARVIPSIPKRINFKDRLVVDGEIICLVKDFEPFAEKYKNPRNFASGSIRLLDAKECATRNLTFVAWDLIEGIEEDNFVARLDFLKDLGFTIVPWIQENISYAIGDIQDICKKDGYPIDGLVFKFNSISYGKSQGETAHHFKNAIAYKFYDEEYETELRGIEYTMGRTGILTPVAIFKAVDDGDSIIERASLHNLNIMKEILGPTPYFQEKVWVCKQNMIIPQIVRAEKELPIFYAERDNIKMLMYQPPIFEIPQVCPICGQPTAINESEQLYCTNPDCEGKWLNKIDHFCSKKGLDIKGLSKATLEKLINKGWINSFKDIFLLKEHYTEWKSMPGFGEKSVRNILNSIEASKSTTLSAFLSAIGIPLVGKTIAKELEKNGIISYEDFRQKVNEKFDFTVFDGFGPEINSAILNHDYSMADEIIELLTFSSVELNKTSSSESKLNGLVFVVTGSLINFKNREELKEFIEKNGGKMTTTISSKTTALINNNTNSTSSKNLTAKKLGVPIYSENEFIDHYSLKI